MGLSKVIFLFVLTCLFSCKEKQVEHSENIKTKVQEDSTKTKLLESTEQIPHKVSELVKRFPTLEQTNKFSYFEELPENLYQLKNEEIERLKLNEKYPKENHQYINWLVYGKTESKNYITLYLFQTIESVCLYQANYSKKDTSLIQLFLLSEWSNPCEEVSSTETKKEGNKYIQTTDYEYQEWTEDGKIGTQFYETIITTYQIKETGKIDSLTSTKKVKTKKLN